jgi:hypothetical protein
LALLVSLPPHARAQRLPGHTWDQFYPKLFATTRNGLTAGAYFALTQQLPEELDFKIPPPYRWSVSADGQVSTSSSWLLRLDARAPGLAEGWRFSATLEGRRRARDNYFGLGNNTSSDSDDVPEGAPHYYQALNTRYFARAEIQRRILGGLRLLVGVHGERWEVEPLPGASVLANDATNGVDPSIGVPTNDISGRIGLVYDSRNDEVGSERGVLLEAIVSAADADIAGDVTYTRTTVSARGFFAATPRLIIAARVAGQKMGGTPPIGSVYLFEASERSFRGLGGPDTHRALQDIRFLGRDKLFGNLEARYALWALPTLFRISVLGFLDAGRVFETEEFRITTEDLKVGGGTGLIFQIRRDLVFGVTTGIGPDGLAADFHTRWPF